MRKQHIIHLSTGITISNGYFSNSETDERSLGLYLRHAFNI